MTSYTFLMSCACSRNWLSQNANPYGLQLIGAEQALMQSMGMNILPSSKTGYAEMMENAHSQLAEAALHAALAAGQAMTMAQTVAYALSTIGSAPR